MLHCPHSTEGLTFGVGQSFFVSYSVGATERRECDFYRVKTSNYAVKIFYTVVYAKKKHYL